MIFALWHRWVSRRQSRWLLLILAVLVLDAYLGLRIIAWEIRHFQEMLP